MNTVSLKVKRVVPTRYTHKEVVQRAHVQIWGLVFVYMLYLPCEQIQI
jgi:hypothetical protein